MDSSPNYILEASSQRGYPHGVEKRIVKHDTQSEVQDGQRGTKNKEINCFLSILRGDTRLLKRRVR